MSLYRTLLAAVAAIALAAPAFAEETITVPAGTSKTESVGGIQVEADASQAQQAATEAQQPGAQTKLNLNTASAKELKMVKGLNPAKARAIVNYRKKHGNFQSIDDLKNVSGFKKMKDEDMKSIQDQLTIG